MRVKGSTRPHGSTGLTLVELLIAMALGLTLTAGVTGIHTASRQLEREQSAHARMQESARFAMHFLARELRMAGSTACPGGTRRAPAGATLNPPSPSLQGWEAGTRINGGGELRGEPDALPATDIIRVGAIADCEPRVWMSTLFYIARRGGETANPPALFRKLLDSEGSTSAAEELVEGVANLRIRYGLSLDDRYPDTVNTWLTAEQVENWSAVISVRLGLLIQSIEDHLAPDSRPYHFHGVSYDGSPGNGPLPDDRRLRRAFTMTVSLRNRVAGG